NQRRQRICSHMLRLSWKTAPTRYTAASTSHTISCWLNALPSLFCRALKKSLFHLLINTVMATRPRLRVMTAASRPRAAHRSSENQYGLVSAPTWRKKEGVVMGRRVLSLILVTLRTSDRGHSVSAGTPRL